jgi:Zn-finger nucleic acid-binding protein
MPRLKCPECGANMIKHKDKELEELISQCPNCEKFFVDKSIFDVQ